MLPEFRAVILDMDGLVLDTEPTYRLAWRRAAADLDCTLTEEFCLGLTGLPLQGVERALAAAFGARLPLPRFRELSAVHWRSQVRDHGIAVKPGLRRLIRALRERRIEVCLATNSRLDNCLECLDLAGVGGLFPRIVARDQVDRGKPAPDLFCAAARLLGVEPRDCLAVEDSDIGIEAAWRAGTIPLMVPGNAVPSAASRRRAHGIFPSLARVAELLEEKGRQGAID